MTTAHKPGDRVVSRMDGPGTIETLAKLTAAVRLDRGGPMARLHLDTLRPEIAWPMQWGGGSNPEGAKVYLVKTADDMRAAADDMRAAAAELLLPADWFAERPVGP